MSWQAFNWSEMMEQAGVAQLGERLQPAIDRTSEVSTEALRLVAAFLTPLALLQAILWAWRLGADLGFAGEFFIEDGILSHGQVWLALAIATQTASVFLNRWLARLPAIDRVRR